MLIFSHTAFSIFLNEAIAGGAPRPDGRKGCVIRIRPGFNSIADEVLLHHYLRAYLDAGLVTVHDAEEPAPPPRTVSKYLPPADRAEMPNPFADAAQRSASLNPRRRN